MKFYEVQRALESGNKVRCKGRLFEEDEYCIKDGDDLYIYNKLGEITYYFNKGMPIDVLFSDRWEILNDVIEVTPYIGAEVLVTCPKCGIKFYIVDRTGMCCVCGQRVKLGGN